MATNENGRDQNGHVSDFMLFHDMVDQHAKEFVYKIVKGER